VNDAPIGVMDSGVGGVSILLDIRTLLPTEHLVYVADSRHAPYGERSEAFIEERVSAILEYLIDERAKAVVVACNTATGVAIDMLRARTRVPIIALEPALKPAAGITRSGRVAVLATHRTLESEKFARLRATHAAGIEVIVQPCPGLAEQVEQGAFQTPATRALVETYVQPLLQRGVDTLVLGCTHYPFLRPLIRDVAGPSVAIIDPGDAVARQLRRQLEHEHLLSDADTPGTLRFVTSGAPADAARVIGELWHSDVHVEGLPAHFAMSRS
jgi:glutamate racemase